MIKKAMTAQHQEKPHRVTVLAYDGLCTFEFAIAVEVFGLPRPKFKHWYDFRVCGLEHGALHATGEIQLTPGVGLLALDDADTIVIPGWRGVDSVPPAKLIQRLIRARDRGVRFLTICSGVFVLAYAGFLDNRRATTHWIYADRLQKQFPKINVDPDVLYIDEGQYVTSAGSAAGLDMCLHVVRQDFGAEIANRVARRLVIAPHRDGGQAQFIERSVDNRPSPLAGLLDWMQSNLHRPLKVESLAKRIAMSKRTFERRFSESTGLPPGEWLKQQRLKHAKDLLICGSGPIEQVAQQVGFGSAENLRHHFRNHVGVSPREYRRRFSLTGEIGE